MTLYNPASLPKNDNLNRFAFAIDVQENLFIRKGKMIAYYGALRFEAMGRSLLDIVVQHAFNAPKYIHDFVVVDGQGQLILGDQGFDIACYDLDQANMTLRVENLLGFTRSVTLQESTLPGFVTLLGTGKVIASSNGPVHFLALPCCVDPDAVLGWADCPTPSYRYDYAHVQGVVAALGAATGITLSGEEKQMQFTGAGTVLVQSSERGMGRGEVVHQLLALLPGLSKTELAQLGLKAQQLSRDGRG